MVDDFTSLCPAPGNPAQERLPRRLGLWSVIAVLIGTTIGSGIFRVPAIVAAQLHSPGLMILAWLLGGIIALCGALTFAELASALPRTGGVLAYLHEGFGPMPAFLFGWAELTVIRAAALGATATIFAEYCGYFVPLSSLQVHYLAAATILLVGLLNYMGVQHAARVMNAASVAKYAVIVALGVLALTSDTGSREHFHAVENSRFSVSLLATAMIPIMWTYDGWADVSFISGEVKNAQRTLPLAFILGTTAVVVAYLILNSGFMYLLSPAEMAHSDLIAATAAGRIPLLGGQGAALIAGLVAVSTFSGLNGSMITGPRIFFAMADRGLFFHPIARVSPRFQTPSAAIALATLLGMVYVLQNNFAELAGKFILGIWPFYALAVVAVFVLRRKQPELPRSYKTWGYPLVPVIFLAASVGIVWNALWVDPLNTGLTFAILSSGVPAYYLWTALGRARGKSLKDSLP